ncbi:alpha-L-fucosidase [Halosquirtibacter laminarini]|uniref:Alpha-L-fucosidase n=1 Tax=Halosquirtibacter laminarini TaxID=3374600 RepID=A0AC61NLY7_9BACT|nr:alpha-L-fucosidase [Prolixibacteraceae bacterium]
MIQSIKMFGLSVLLSVSLLAMASEKAEQQEKVHFKPTIKSLEQYQCPEWFRDAKLGIYMHWGVYSVAEQGEWYARKMYMEGTKEYEHHVKTYGHPSEFGYKDFIPMWKAEKFDPDKLVALFKKAGAKYFSPCAVHHDNFDLWNSKYHKYNAVNMGPKKDLIGMWKKATLKHGLRFGVTTHLSRSYSWFNTNKLADTKGPKKGVRYDGADPKYTDFYFEDHKDIHPRAPENAPKKWRKQWERRIKDLIDNYDPDILYFDCAIPFRGDDQGKTGMKVLSHLYNHSQDIHQGKQEAVMCIKERPWQGVFYPGVATLDFERGKANHILSDPWQTDDSIGPWGYKKGATYMTPNMVIDKLIDIVSKNGNMLLNVPIKADGTLDSQTTNILEKMGEWMSINGEAIFGTRPWYMFGEGPTNEIHHRAQKSPFTKKDIRYTKKENTLYAFIMDWPGNNKVVKFPHLTKANLRIKPIKSIQMLGCDQNIHWSQEGDALMVTMPSAKPCDNAFCVKIEFKK